MRTLWDKIADRLILAKGKIFYPKIMSFVGKFGNMIGPTQAAYLYSLAKKRKGNILDIGSNIGLSTAILAASGNKVFAFEWFQGLPAVSEYDPAFKEGDYKSSKEVFKKNIKEAGGNVELVEGDCLLTIPEEIGSKKIKSFYMAFIDLDLYETTKKTIENILQIARGGEIILSHDYPSEGIQKAIKEITTNYPVVVEREWPVVTLRVLDRR